MQIGESMKDWLNIDYLKDGSQRQRECFRILNSLNVMEVLGKYSPILVGTIPIEIDVAGSDADIICSSSSLDEVKRVVNKYFSQYPNFFEKLLPGKYYVANFEFKDFEVEIYVESTPSKEQYAYKHMIVESRILKLMGLDFRDQIITLKKQGYKTEPAFGILLNLDDSYNELLELADFSEAELLSFLSTRI